jgi:hypothetical protein
MSNDAANRGIKLIWLYVALAAVLVLAFVLAWFMIAPSFRLH